MVGILVRGVMHFRAIARSELSSLVSLAILIHRDKLTVKEILMRLAKPLVQPCSVGWLVFLDSNLHNGSKESVV